MRKTFAFLVNLQKSLLSPLHIRDTNKLLLWKRHWMVAKPLLCVYVQNVHTLFHPHSFLCMQGTEGGSIMCPAGLAFLASFSFFYHNVVLLFMGWSWRGGRELPLLWK